MPGDGRPWRRESAAYKAECKKRNAPCWICSNTRGPIDYDAPPRTPLSFTVDHKTPTSHGGAVTRRSNWAPAHFSCNSSRGNVARGDFPNTRRW